MSIEILFKFSNDNNLIAIRSKNQIITYKELFSNAISLSSFLEHQLIKSETFVPILYHNSSKFIEIILSLWNISKCPVLFSTRWTDNEVEDIIKTYNFKQIIIDDSLDHKLNRIEINKIIISNFSLNSIYANRFNQTLLDINDPALVIFTSGSSDKPKGVVHSLTTLINSVLNADDILEIKLQDKLLASLPFYHIGGFQIITRALLNGGEIIIPDNLDISSLIESITVFKPTHISLVSTQLKRFLEINFSPPDEIKATLVGGGFVEDNLIDSAYKSGWNPYRVYGSSETASFVTAANANEILLRPNTVGKPMKNSIIKIVDNNEIIISSNSLFKGYLKETKDILDVKKNNFFFTNDIGWIDNDQYLFIDTKRTDLIITGGENVNPYEVEKLIFKIDGIQDVCVFPKSDKHWGQIVAAVIVTDKKISEDEIKNYLKKKLASFKIPKVFYFVDSLPKTSIDKIDRQKIIKQYS